jgi:Rap1a immunity proteins
MKMISFVLSLLLLVSMFSVGQQASVSDSHDLASTGTAFLRVCDRSDVRSESGHIRALCMAYVSGVSDGAQFIAIERLHAPLFCLTPDADNWHLFAAALAYLKAHPEKTDSQTRALVIDALIATFPCHASK